MALQNAAAWANSPPMNRPPIGGCAGGGGGIGGVGSIVTLSGWSRDLHLLISYQNKPTNKGGEHSEAHALKGAYLLYNLTPD